MYASDGLSDEMGCLNAAQRRTASRSLFIRRARLPLWAVVRIVEGSRK